MDILFITDDRYVAPTLVTLTSVCVNNPGSPITFHILMDKGTRAHCEDKLVDAAAGYGKQCCVHRHDFSRYGEMLPIGRKNMPLHCSIATYYRLFLCDIMPATIGRLIYLDGDIIVRKPLDEMWDSIDKDTALMGVRDCWEGDISKYNRLRYHPRYGYFNAGVLLLNLDYWREHSIQKELIDFLNTHPERIIHHDQDVLNACLHDRKAFLPFRYNVQDGYLMDGPNLLLLGCEEEFIAARTAPSILHYCSSDKPWLPSSRHPYVEEYRHYMRLAGLESKDFPHKILTRREKIRKLFVLVGILNDPDRFLPDLHLS